MKKRFIGVTLMFWIKNIYLYQAIQSSYILDLDNYQNLQSEIRNLSIGLLETEFKGYNYSGVTDLYISEQEGLGNYLGRTSYFDCKTISAAKKMILSTDEVNIIIQNHTLEDRFNVGFVYFNKDSEGPDYNSTLVVNTQLSKLQSFQDLEDFAIQIDFKQKIINFSVEQLALEDLYFIGVSEIYTIKSRGLFSISGEFKNCKDFETALIGDGDLKRKFDEIITDYKYVG